MERRFRKPPRVSIALILLLLALTGVTTFVYLQRHRFTTDPIAHATDSVLQ